MIKHTSTAPVNAVVMQRVVASQRDQHRLLLTLECGHTMDAANDAEEVPCFECRIEMEQILMKSKQISLSA